jgi:hypothetical protein
MKKLFLFAIVIGISYSLHAQVYVGGSLGAWSKKVGDIETNSINFYPEVGYSFPGNWHAGVVIGFGQTETGDVKNSVYEFTPYAGYTFFQQGIAALFVEAGFSFLHTKPHVGDAVNGFKTGLKRIMKSESQVFGIKSNPKLIIFFTVFLVSQKAEMSAHT